MDWLAHVQAWSPEESPLQPPCRTFNKLRAVPHTWCREVSPRRAGGTRAGRCGRAGGPPKGQAPWTPAVWGWAWHRLPAATRFLVLPHGGNPVKIAAEKGRGLTVRRPGGLGLATSGAGGTHAAQRVQVVWAAQVRGAGSSGWGVTGSTPKRSQ